MTSHNLHILCYRRVIREGSTDLNMLFHDHARIMLNHCMHAIYNRYRSYFVLQYSEWAVGPLSSAACPPLFMQFTGCHQPGVRFYWLENAIDWLGEC